METQVVELTAEQLEALTSVISLYGHVCAVCVVVCAFFLAFELAAFCFWWTLFRE